MAIIIFFNIIEILGLFELETHVPKLQKIFLYNVSNILLIWNILYLNFAIQLLNFWVNPMILKSFFLVYFLFYIVSFPTFFSDVKNFYLLQFLTEKLLSVISLGHIIFYFLTGYYYFFIYFYFSIVVGLQCSVNVLLYSKVTQSLSLTHTHTHTHTHIHILFFTLSSIMFRNKWLDVVPCATQQDLISYPLQMQQFASVNPKLPVHPPVCSPSPCIAFLTGYYFYNFKNSKFSYYVCVLCDFLRPTFLVCFETFHLENFQTYLVILTFLLVI